MTSAFEQTAEAIPYLSRHAFLLYGMVRWLRPDTIVEVGTHIGHTAAWLARALQENNKGHLYCIDPFCWTNESQEEQWEANLTRCGVRDLVTLIRGRSQEVEWPASVDFCFVDGNHTYDVCKFDTEKAQVSGASCIAIHDTVSWEGTRQYAEGIRRQIRMEESGVLLKDSATSWLGWDIFEAEFDCGITVLKNRFPKGQCEGFDIGEQWDRPTGGANAPA